MSMGFMVTNGGPHPPEKWADVTARQIADLIVIEPTASTQAIVDKRQFETALFALLVDLHKQTQEHECSCLKDHGHEHLLSKIDPTAHVTSAVAQVSALAQATVFAEHFAKSEVQVFLHNVLGQHFANSMHIERSWHADRNPDSPHAKAFHAKHSARKS